MKKLLPFVFALFGFIVGALFFSLQVQAVEYPISELGNCRNQRECHFYCEVPANKAACWSYKVYINAPTVLGDESPETKLAQLGITFPVPELGNCANVSACKAYCSNSANATVCRQFSQSHRQTLNEQLVVRAQEELGCTTQEECKSLCSLEENRSRCTQFAARWKIRNTVQNRLVTQAQSILGCASAQECKTFCLQDENKQKCADFATQMGLQVKQKLMEKVGCTTAEECRKLCEENPNRCPGYPNSKNRPVSSLQPQFAPPKTGTPTVSPRLKPSGIFEPVMPPPKIPQYNDVESNQEPTY